MITTHVPLTHRDDGTPILGLKRCTNCGLSETYWQRWPACESRSGHRFVSKLRPQGYIGHLGCQQYDDTLAHNAETAPQIFSCDLSAIELRVLARQLGRFGFLARLVPYLPNRLLKYLLYR